LPHNLQSIGIEDWAENKLRIELRLLSKHITKVKNVFNEYVGRIEMSEQIALSDTNKMNLPTKLRSTYTLWIEGHDLRDMLSKSAYYRHRAELKEYGINIDLRPESTRKPNVVPFVLLNLSFTVQ
jgi:II/X family phage/plasmid replication protein